MAQPQDLLYSKEHEWAKLDGENATIGITDYAQESLGDIVYVELPKVGTTIEQFFNVGVDRIGQSRLRSLYADVRQGHRDQRSARRRSRRRQPRALRRRLALQAQAFGSRRSKSAAQRSRLRKDYRRLVKPPCESASTSAERRSRSSRSPTTVQKSFAVVSRRPAATTTAPSARWRRSSHRLKQRLGNARPSASDRRARSFRAPDCCATPIASCSTGKPL